MSLVPVHYRLAALTHEKDALLAYPQERLASIIKDIGFRCTTCAKCCTRSFNGHVFLLDRDVTAIRRIDPSALEPAPDPEFCDQNGIFYVSGYSIRIKDDENGSCWFLENGRCRIYDQRFAICRVYPYMLHREPDERGKIDWRQISGLDQHGEYDAKITDDESQAIARETVEYEQAILDHQIAFLEFIQEEFARKNLRHIQKIHDDRMRQYWKGEPITVMVYSEGKLTQYRLQKGEILK